MVTTTADSGAGSLRQAILDANNTATNPGQNTIHFNVATSGVQTINLASGLPAITNSSGVIIDATTEPGFTSTPMVVLNGTGAGNSNGFLVSGGNTTIKGLAIENFASGAAILLASSGNTIQGDFLGTDATGATAGANSFGVDIASASNNTIGGTTTAARNVISGNTIYGVVINGSSSTGNLVEGNFIGTNNTGNTALANGSDGVAILSAARNTIGGTSSAAANVISGNARFGIFLEGTGTSGNVVEGNLIGTNQAGSAALANSDDGVALYGGASSNTIGGTTSSAANVLSGNSRFGLLLSDSGTTGNLVEGNTIGLNKAGTAILANTDDGVEILNAASANTIGGSTTGAGNVIAGNGRFGVLLGTTGTTGNVVAGNFIGTNSSSAASLGNTASGVALVTGASGNTIGGTTSAAANVISGNSQYGILLTDSSTTNNLVEGNFIGTSQAASAALANSLDGIAVMGAPGNTIGGTATGAGNVISGNSQFGIVLAANTTLVQGNFIGTDAASDNKLGNTDDGLLILSSGNTIGGTASGAGNTVSGNERFGIQLEGTAATGNVIQGNFVGTNPAGTVSQTNIDDGIALYGGASNNTIGGTTGSAANVLSGNGRFGLLLSDSGTTGNLVEGNVIGVNKAASAILANTNDGVAILNGATGNTIGGTATGAENIISGNGQMGVLIGGTGTTGNVVDDNFIGTNSGGTTSLPNLYAGVMVATGASSNTIGGTASDAGNTIAFNGTAGVVIGVNSTDTTVGDAVLTNSIYSNGGAGGIGIDLGNHGTTPNDSAGHTGPNHFQNTPVVTGAGIRSGNMNISFTFTSVPSSTFTVLFYLNNSGDTAQGRTFLGSVTVTTDANGALATISGGTVTGGVGTVTITPPTGVTPTAGQGLTATATLTTTTATTGTAGDTSEFSPSVTVTTISTLAITTTSLPAWTAGQSGYNQTISTSGGLPPVRFTESGNFPAGLTLSTSGVLTGTPTTAGSFTFTVMAMDAQGQTASQSYTIVINAAPTITTTALPNGTVNEPSYSQTIAVSGGTAPLRFATTTGALPTGLALNPSTGVISGSPTAAGPFSFTVTATDAVGATTSHPYTLTINPAVSITTTSLPNGAQNIPYSQTINVTGGSGTYTFSSTGTLPTGLTLNPSTGVLSGTPTAASTYSFTVRATDSLGGSDSKTYSVTISMIGLSPTSLPNGDVNLAYSQTITATGGTMPYTFSSTGTLPTGLTLNSSTAVLSGTPTATGTFAFTITATDSASPTHNTGSQNYTVTINPAVSITTTSLANGTQNVAYSQTISVTGGSGAPYTFSSTGTLPTGLTLNPSTGVLSGTPTAASTYSFTVKATDSLGGSDSKAYSVTISVIGVSPTSLPNGDVNVAYSQTIRATGAGTAPFTFTTSSGTLPTGLTLNSSTGVLSGTPSATGTFAFTITVTDSASPTPNTGSQSYTIVISAAPTITTTALPNGTVNQPSYSQAIAVSGGTAPIRFSTTTGTLPTGLTLNPSTGVISGSPTAAGPFSFTVTATDAAGATTSQPYTVTINPAVAITTTSLPAATANQSYSQIIHTSGGTGTITFTESGSLPNGLTLSTTGVLSGTPTTANTFTFQVTATDSVGASASHVYIFTVNAALAITTASLSNWTVNQAGYSQNISTTGGTAPVTFAASSGTLPTGLTLSSAGVLSGTPTASNSFTFTVTATDAAMATASQSYTVVINPAVTITTTSLPSGATGTAYSQTIAATGGTGMLSFSAPAASLPPGLTLSSTGVVSGTPTSSGSFTFPVTATDAVGASGNQNVTVFVTAPPTATAPISNVSVAQNHSPTLIDLAAHFGSPDIVNGNTTVTLNTSSGPINLTLFDQSAPQTVANFVDYAQSGAYNDTIFHRLANLSTNAQVSPTNPAQIIQSGGFALTQNPTNISAIPSGPAIMNEYSTSHPNAPDTIAMARTSDPNSATNQFFINITDNSTALGVANGGGFAVFGQFADTTTSSSTLTSLTGIPTFDQSGGATTGVKAALTNIPLSNFTNGSNDPNFPGDTTASNYALINSVTVTQKDALTYSIVSVSNPPSTPNLVTASFVPNHPEQLQLSYAPNQTGMATIVVKATNKNGQSVTQTFTVTVTT